MQGREKASIDQTGNFSVCVWGEEWFLLSLKHLLSRRSNPRQRQVKWILVFVAWPAIDFTRGASREADVSGWVIFHSPQSVTFCGKRQSRRPRHQPKSSTSVHLSNAWRGSTITGHGAVLCWKVNLAWTPLPLVLCGCGFVCHESTRSIRSLATTLKTEHPTMFLFGNKT